MSGRPSPRRPATKPRRRAFGMRQASLRQADDDRTYVRLAHFFFPFVVVVPNGYGSAVHVFCFAPDRRHPSSGGLRQLRRDAALAPRRQRRAHRRTPRPRATSPRCGVITRTGGARTGSSWPRALERVRPQRHRGRHRRCRRAWVRSSIAPRRTSRPATSPSPTPAASSSTRSPPTRRASSRPAAPGLLRASGSRSRSTRCSAPGESWRELQPASNLA